MNYLYKNRDNSRKLPFDVLNIIYEYADPFLYVKKQIIHKSYCLDDFMYKRMKKEIGKTFSNSHNGWGEYVIYKYNILWNYNSHIIITPSNINAQENKIHIVNFYKLLFSPKPTSICGLATFLLGSYRTKIIMDLEANGHTINRRYSTKQLYKKWIKL